MTVLFVFALRHEELSILYPIISLTYVWVAGLSTVFFGESLGWLRTLGIVAIVLGVAVLGKDGRK
jgi:drug/metabolite transporter (DMT)-like permease